MILVFNNLIGFVILFFSNAVLKINNNFKVKYTFLIDTILKTRGKHIDRTIIQAIIAIEDKRFYYHPGFDIFSIARALKNNLFNDRLQGASTINQQLVRTLLNEREISYKRKIIEIALATLINYKFTKDQILNCYLNVCPFKGCIGIEELCNKEGYEMSLLTIIEASEIVARVKFPTITAYNYLRYLKRVRTIQILINK